MLPPSVHALIATSLGSAAALELLLLLQRSPDTYWTATAAAATLGASEERMAAALQSLQRNGLLEQARETVAFRYAPRNDEARRTVEALASAYDHQRVAVLDAVYAAATGAIEAFAEAFRLRPR
jgi:3-dehydroquinate dehydratase